MTTATRFTALKQLTLSEAERTEGSSLFVINISNPSGNVHFSVDSVSGRTSVVSVPAAPVPFDLTTQAKKMDIIGSPNFRRFIASRDLVIVDSIEAEEFMKNPKAQTEYNKAMRIETAKEFSPSTMVKHTEEVSDIPDGLTPIVISVCGNEEMPERDVIDLLENNLHTFSMADLQYVLDNSIHTSVKTWAATQLQS